MSLRPAAPLLAATAVLAVLLLTAAFHTAARRPNADATPAVAPAPLIAFTRSASATAYSAQPMAISAAPTPRSTIPSLAPRSLEPDAQTLLTEQIALRQLVGETGLTLTDEQWRAFADVSAECQEIRVAYEATLAQVIHVRPGVLQIEIPLYPEAGDALRARFESGLRERLGNAAATQILASLGNRLESYFGGFGVSMQTVNITAPAADDVQITRLVRRGVSSQGDTAAFAFNSETFLPREEDPAGLRWGPFLALFASNGATAPR